MKLKKMILLISLSLSFSLYANEPQYSFTFKDAEKGYAFIQDSKWAKDFFNSNLYQGLTLRLGTVLNALATEEDDSWKGKLISFFYSEILEGKALEISYFHEKPLSSPFGIYVTDLGEKETALLKKMISSLSTGRTRNIDGDQIIPLKIKSYRVGVLVKKSCFAMSRDPHLVGRMMKRCLKAKKPKNDLTVKVDLKKAAPSILPFLQKFSGIGRELSLDFTYDEKAKLFSPSGGNIELGKEHIFKNMKFSEADLSPIPADSFFFVSSWLPRPENLSTEGVKKILKEKKEKLRGYEYFPVTLIHMGMHKDLSAWSPLTAIVFKYPNISDQTFMELDKTIGFTQYFSSKYKKVCGDYIAISDQDEAIKRIEDSCNNRQASISNLDSKKINLLTKKKSSFGIFLNLGDHLEKVFNYSWDRSENPAEVLETRKILKSIPDYTFSGKVGKNSIDFKGIKL